MGKNINHVMLMLSGWASAAGFSLKRCQSLWTAEIAGSVLGECFVCKKHVMRVMEAFLFKAGTSNMVYFKRQNIKLLLPRYKKPQPINLKTDVPEEGKNFFFQDKYLHGLSGQKDKQYLTCWSS